MTDDFVVISLKRTFKGFSEEYRKTKLNEFLSSLEEKSSCTGFSNDWRKSFEGIEKPHQKQDCLDCNNELMCGECVLKRILNCFNCELERTCETCLDQISQKKTHSTDINVVEKKSANECNQTLPYCIGEYEPKQDGIDFESVGEYLKTCLKTKIYLFMDSNIMKQMKPINLY